MFWVIRMYLRAAARTFRLHKYTHGSHLTLRITNDLGFLRLAQRDYERDLTAIRRRSSRLPKR